MREALRKAFQEWATNDGYPADGVNHAKLHAEAGWQAATAHIFALLDRPEALEAVRLQIYSHSPLNTPASAELAQRIMPALKEEISK